MAAAQPLGVCAPLVSGTSNAKMIAAAIRNIVCRMPPVTSSLRLTIRVSSTAARGGDSGLFVQGLEFVFRENWSGGSSEAAGARKRG
jgi:hypothetical protein